MRLRGAINWSTTRILHRLDYAGYRDGLRVARNKILTDVDVRVIRGDSVMLNRSGEGSQ